MGLRIAAVSDMHGKLRPEHLPDADTLIIAGDYLPNFSASNGGRLLPPDDARKQLEWLPKKFLPRILKKGYRKIIVIAGNHDWVHEFPGTAPEARKVLEDAGVAYLQDEPFEFEGVKFYGSPWQPWFCDWAFQIDERDELAGYPHSKAIWSKIPAGVDVLVTHGPPRDILDKAPGNRRVGCPILREQVFSRVKPQVHVFGHIHEGYGTEERLGVNFLNVALCDGQYEPNQKIQVIEVTPR